MKLAAIDNAEVYRLLNRRLNSELASINSVLKRNAEENRRLLSADISEINSNIQTLKLGMESAKDNASQSLKSGLADLERQLYAIDLSGTVEGIQGQVSSLTRGIMELMQKAEDKPDESAPDNETLQFLLDEIKRLESRIEFDKQRQLPYLAMPSVNNQAPADSGTILDGEMLFSQIQFLRRAVQNLIDDMIEAVNNLADQDTQTKLLSMQNAINTELRLMNARIEEAFDTTLSHNDVDEVEP